MRDKGPLLSPFPGDHLAVHVLSPGNPIPSVERSKIHEGYYRGINARRNVPGSGLFVARKIELALGGSLDLEAERGAADGLTFRLILPVPENERSDHAATV